MLELNPCRHPTPDEGAGISGLVGSGDPQPSWIPGTRSRGVDDGPARADLGRDGQVSEGADREEPVRLREVVALHGHHKARPSSIKRL